MICEIEISTEISVSFLERLHEIEREIISHRAAKTVNGNFMLARKKSFSVPTLVCPPGLEPGPGASEARQDFKISCFIRNILHFLHICRKYLTRFAYFT